jgi:hypothetical protein
MAHCHVDGAAGLIGRKDLALEVFDGLDRAVLADDEGVGVIAGNRVLTFVGDDPQICHASMLDPEREGRIGECRAIELARG